MLYYGMLSSAVIMFGLQFFFTQIFERECTSSAKSGFILTFGSSIYGIIILLIINGAHALHITLFSVLTAVVVGINCMIFTYCSMKALGNVNLSLYSIFSMIGGMMLPFAAGLLFFNEKASGAKILCFLAIALSVIITIKGDSGKKGLVYCFGVFFTNGLSGVISTFHQTAGFDKCNEAEYSILCALVTGILSGIAILVTKGDKIKLTKNARLAMCGYGVLCRVGNYLLLLALAVLPASVQYPFVTGGVIIVSTVISIITGQKPSKAEIISMLIAFAGVVALTFVK